MGSRLGRGSTTGTRRSDAKVRRDLLRTRRFRFRRSQITQSEIIEFAENYDSQPFHTDPETAADSLFDGLVASGWHVVSVTKRLVTDAVYGPAKVLGGYGTEELRFHRPTRPGDTLNGAIEVVEISPRWGHPAHDTVRFSIRTRGTTNTLCSPWITLALSRDVRRTTRDLLRHSLRGDEIPGHLAVSQFDPADER